LPLFTRVVYDRIVPNFAEATLWVLFSGMVLVLAFELLFKVSRAYMTDHLGNRAAAQLEQEFQQHLLRLPHGYSIAQTGQFFSLLQDIRDFFCQRLVPTLVDVPFVLTFIIAIFLISPAMALVPLVIGLLLIGMQYGFQALLHQVMQRQQQTSYQKQNALVELLHGRDTIRQLSAQAPFLAGWNNASDQAADATAQLATWQGLMQHLSTALILLNSLLLIIVGVYEIHANSLSVGGLIAINILSSRMLSPLTAVGTILAKWPHMISEMRTIEKVLALAPDKEESEEPFTLLGAVSVQQASVHYPNHALPALKDASFALARGQKLALVGPSGAGKTTLLKALSAEVGLASGLIRWDEHDITHLPPAGLRGQMGIVDQYPFFFARSLRENLLMGLEKSDEDIRAALEIAGMDGMVKASGRGLDLPIEEGGVNLSGGQRQCLAIARALLRKPAVLLMDEPTSMMDHMMEARLVQHLRSAMQGVTLVVVTHRSPLLALVDAVAVMDQGRITRFGARDDVLKAISQVESKHAH
ncbi:MAG: ATP-binding cassette domain-containing protein, partial [Rickettsiales bacterium]|nr:ATP-binding cassette domain-containing protein [Rickettsiales bacterium]